MSDPNSDDPAVVDQHGQSQLRKANTALVREAEEHRRSAKELQAAKTEPYPTDELETTLIDIIKGAGRPPRVGS